MLSNQIFNAQYKQRYCALKNVLLRANKVSYAVHICLIYSRKIITTHCTRFMLIGNKHEPSTHKASP